MQQVMVIGDLLIDRYFLGNVNRVSPENTTIPVLSVTKERRCLGGAGNVALNLRNMGCDVRLLSQVGYGPNSLALNDLVDEEGFLVHRVFDGVSGICTKHRGITFAGQQLFRFDDDQIPPAADLQRLMIVNVLKESLPAGELSAVVVSDYAKSFLDDETRRQIVSMCNHYRVPTFVDCKPAAVQSYSGATCLKLNLAEALATADDCVHPGLTAQFADDPISQARIASEHIAKKGFWLVVTTMAELGAVLADPNQSSAIAPAASQPCKSVVGAGDVFLAGLVATWLKGCSPEMNVKAAMQLATHSTTKQFTCHITQEEWAQFSALVYPESNSNGNSAGT